MEKQQQITIERVRRILDELKAQFWVEQHPLRVSVFQSQEPIPFTEAVQQQFTPIELGFHWGPQWSTAWFHLQGTYPAEWAGSTVAALIDTGSEALVWVNGAPAQGLDPNRQDFVITHSAEEGGEVDLYVEAAGNHPFGTGGSAGDTPFTFTKATVARFNAPIWHLYHDLRVLFDLAVNLPEDADRRARLIFALNEAVNIYRRGGAAAIPSVRELLAIEYAKPACASALTVNVLGHSHIDIAWLWPLRETVRKCARTFCTVLKYMEDYPEYRYVQSQPQLYAFVKEQYPELFTRMKQAVVDGRWEPQGAMWVEPDCNIISGESMVRQILYGTRFFREEFGVENTILWLPDTFGFSGALPQVLAGSGIDYFLTQKLCWNQFNRMPHHTFHWEGIDGSRVLAHFLPADTYIGLLTPGELLRGEKNFIEKDRAGGWLNLYGYGDGGGGPVKEMLESYRRERDLEGLPKVTQEPARDWFPRMAAEAHDLPTWNGELYLEYHRGTYTTQAKNKWENRRCELLLRDAEFLAAINPHGVDEYPAAELEEAWKLVLRNQFHDILPGSSIRQVYEDAARDYARVHEIGDAVIAKALGVFTAAIDTSKLSNPVVVWNTLPFLRSGVLSLPWDGEEDMVVLAPNGQPSRTQLTEEDGERRLLVEVLDVPSMGYLTIDLLDGTMPEDMSLAVTDTVTASERTLENDLVYVELNDFGGIVSYYDRQADRELIADGKVGNLFQRFDDHPNAWDAWDIDPFFAEVGEDLCSPAEITVVESGPVRATLRVARELTPKAQMVQYIRLEANSRRLDFETYIDWHEDKALLKVAFPVNIHSSRATYEIQYGHIERPTHRNTSWDVARFEVPAQKWADLSESDYGIALLNDGKYGYDIQRNVMRLSLLRATTDPDPQADRGQHHFTYSLLPHRGDASNSGVPLAGYDLNVPMRALLLPVQEGVLAQTHAYFRLDKPNLVLDSVKRAEDGDGIIIRLYEAFRRRGTARLITNGLCSRATRTDLLERNQEEVEVRGGAIWLDYRPFEIITLRLQ